MAERHLITCELAPMIGGVAAYTRNLANALAAEGDAIHVWCPRLDQAPKGASFVVHQELGRFSPADLARAGRQLDRFGAQHHLLVQWVPHGYGYRAMNLPFCLWLWWRALKGDVVDVMVHEAFVEFGVKGLRHNVMAVTQRLMAIALLRAARRVWVSTPRWGAALRPYALGRSLPMTWLPVPNSIAVVDDPEGVCAIRRRYMHGASAHDTLLGHFGMHGPLIVALLKTYVPALLSASPHQRLLLIGQGSEEALAAICQDAPHLAPRMSATGALGDGDVSRHLQACDVMVQPYPDGVSARRTSVMAALSHARPVVTTAGVSTEPVWKQSHAVRLISCGDVHRVPLAVSELEQDIEARTQLGRAGALLHETSFSISRTVAEVRAPLAEGSDARGRRCADA